MAPTATEQLDELRRQWRMWAAVRTDRAVNYCALDLTADDLDRARGEVPTGADPTIVAALLVRDRKLAEIEQAAAAVKALVSGGVA